MCQNLRPVLLPREPPLRPKLPEDDDREELRELPDEEELLVLLPEDEELPPNRPPREPSPLSVPELRGVPAAGAVPAEVPTGAVPAEVPAPERTFSPIATPACA